MWRSLLGLAVTSAIVACGDGSAPIDAAAIDDAAIDAGIDGAAVDCDGGCAGVGEACGSSDVDLDAGARTCAPGAAWSSVAKRARARTSSSWRSAIATGIVRSPSSTAGVLLARAVSSARMSWRIAGRSARSIPISRPPPRPAARRPASSS